MKGATYAEIADQAKHLTLWTLGGRLVYASETHVAVRTDCHGAEHGGRSGHTVECPLRYQGYVRLFRREQVTTPLAVLGTFVELMKSMLSWSNHLAIAVPKSGYS